MDFKQEAAKNMGFQKKQRQHAAKVGFKRNNKFGRIYKSTASPPTTETTVKTTAIKAKKLTPRLSQRILSKREGVRSPSHEYIIANTDLLEDLYYDGYTKHRVYDPQCSGRLQMIKKEMRIISGSWLLCCTVCDFKQKGATKLYRTNPPGPRGGRPESTLNVMLSHALISSSVGASVFRELMLRIGVQAGSHSGIQKILSSKSNNTVTEIAKRNMAEVRKNLNKKHPDGVSISADGWYPTRQNQKTPFQASNQLVYSVAENNTPEKKIMMIVAENKLCSKKTSGKKQNCEEHTCSADLRPDDPIGQEKRPALKCARQLKIEGTKVKSVTNDSDTTVFPAFKEHHPEAVSYKDPRHMANIFKNHIINSELSSTMFPGAKSIAKRRQNWFAEDLRQRCEAELTSAINKAKLLKDHSLETIQNMLKKTPDAIISCYAGDCSLCDEHSFCCNEKKKWPKMFCRKFPSKNQFKMTEEDRNVLRRLIDFRLGDRALSVTFTGQSTQKNEAFNRSLSKHCPKTVTFSKTFVGRAHAAALTVNAGFDGSTEELQQAAGHQVSESVKRQIAKHEERIKYSKNYQKTKKYKDSRILRRSLLYRLHEKKYQEGEERDLGYLKNSDVHPLLPDGNDHKQRYLADDRPGPR